MNELVCDVLVVGGGIAGVSIGSAIAAERQVLLVETEAQLALHSTGRSAAVYLPSYGGPVVRRLTVASRTLYDQLSEERDDPLLSPRSLLWVAVDSAGERVVRGLAVESDLETLDATEAVTLCSALRPERVLTAGLDAGGMEIEVAGLHQAYLRRLNANGGTVLVASPIRRITRRSRHWEIDAGDNHITAGTVVDAAGAWADQVAAMAGVPTIGLAPKRRSAFLSPVRGSYPDRARWPLVNDAAEGWYFKPDGGGVLVSPADETASDPCDARPDELEIARAIEAVNANTSLQLRSVSHAWAGLRSFVSDGAPVVGARRTEPDFFFFAGQGGYGIQMGPALAELGASLLLTGAVPSRLAAAGIDTAAVSPERLAG